MKEADIVTHISRWLKDYCTNAGTKGFVVGISGGIDSALSSTLAAMTGLPTLVLELPIHQAPSQVNRALKHAAWLQKKYPNVIFKSVALADAYESLILGFDKDVDAELLNLTLANTRARLRMSTLYYYAGIKQSLVVGTGNKVEDFGVGFFTKYGDGGVDLSPIADLMKSEVYQLARYLGVHEEILNAAPTDGLWGDDRTDEDQLGASYDELEWAMQFKGSTEGLNERKKEVLSLYKRLHRANLHKMNPIPVCEIPEELK